MPKFVFAYHGGKMADTPEESAKQMEKWKAWFADMGSDVVEIGNPVGLSKTVSADGVADNGGSNPLSGFSLVSADNIEAAVELAKGCPIVTNEGSVEVAEAIDIDM